MAKFISDEGIQYPANERIGLKNETKEMMINPSVEGSRFYGEEVEPGDDYIYEGPCRDAIKILTDLGLYPDPGFMGEHYTTNNDLINLAKYKHYDTVQDYVKGEVHYDAEEAQNKIKEYREKFFSRKPAERVKPIKPISGGRNTAGTEGSISGGMGDIPK